MQFIDEARVYIKAGDGGNGSAAMRRESKVPRGGPAGGDGGDGGDVVFVADTQLGTLLDFKYKRHYKAKRGEDGRGKDQYGKGGEDLILRVPVGTIIFDDDTGEVLADLDADEARCIAARGGHGGRGNIHFKTSRNQAPRRADPGTPGQERTVRLELKLLADVGLLGFPSVGKSTLIAKVSRARPKIAAYPFTTLIPNLGVVQLSDDRSLIMADIPGLIEGAAEGVGLGHRFLRHVERTRILLHVIEAHEMLDEGRDPVGDYDTLNRELRRYAPELAHKPQIVALNKIDLPETRARAEDIRGSFAERGIEVHLISGVSGEGIAPLLEMLWQRVRTVSQ